MSAVGGGAGGARTGGRASRRPDGAEQHRVRGGLFRGPARRIRRRPDQSAADRHRVAGSAARTAAPRCCSAARIPASPACTGCRCTPDGLRRAGRCAGAPPVSSPQDPETLAALLYTAGTSGEPKAAMLTHRALLAHLSRPRGARASRSGDGACSAMLPLFHVFGLNAVLGSWVGAGARLVIMDGFDGFLDVLMLSRSPTCRSPRRCWPRSSSDERSAGGLGSVSTVISGAAPLPEDLRAAFTARTGLRVEQGYGLTEAAPGVSATLGRPATRAWPRRSTAARRRRSGSATASDPTEPGEISIRGANLFSGYWPDGRDGPDPEGWFRDRGHRLPAGRGAVPGRPLPGVDHRQRVQRLSGRGGGGRGGARRGRIRRRARSSGSAYGGAGRRLRHRERASRSKRSRPIARGGWPSSSDPA